MNLGTLHLLRHPVAEVALRRLRDKNTDVSAFQQASATVSALVIAEATRDLPTRPAPVLTPLAEHASLELATSLVFVPVLRAGLAMLPAARELFPDARVGFLGLERDEATAIASRYYAKLPAALSESTVIILDPMLATGGSLCHAAEELIKKGATNLRCACIVAAPEGVARCAQEHPSLQVFTAALDSHLNEKKYIVPGLGDFGDRYFGTVAL